MRYELATDNQLLTIIKHDKDCPHSLLSGAVLEVLNRGLFDQVIGDCLRRVIKNIKKFEQVHQVSSQDFMQMGRIFVLEALKRFKANKNKSFMSFVFLRVKHEFIKQVIHIEAQKRDNRKVCSYQVQTEQGDEIGDFFPSKVNVETYVVNKVTLEQLLKRVNDHQRKVILYRLQGYTFTEISKLLNRGSLNTMEQAYRYGIEKMRKGA